MTRRRRQHFVEGKYYRVNEEIRAPEIRVIHSKKGQLGVLSREEALRQAQQADLDLVEVAPGVKPPVAKLIDFAKFKYDQSKKKKATKAAFTETKQLRLRPFMDEHDIQVRLKKISKFLKNGSRVKIQVRFFGREITKKKFGFELINNIMDKLGELAKLHEEPKLKGKTIEALIIPKT